MELLLLALAVGLSLLTWLMIRLCASIKEPT